MKWRTGALRCNVQNMSNASELGQAVIEWYFRNSSWLWNYCTMRRRVILSNVKQKCGPFPPRSAVNLNKLNLIEIQLFIKMLYGVWSSLQPDHETNKYPRRMQVTLQPGTMTGRRSETFEDLLYISSEDKYKGFSLVILKGRLTDRLESTKALWILNGPKSFFVASRLIPEVNTLSIKNTGHTR